MTAVSFDSFNLDAFNYENIFLATKLNYYQFNSANIIRLTENLLYRNRLLNQEIDILYPNQGNLNRAKHDNESNVLMDKCLENQIDHEFILKTLWQRIYNEPVVMKFISMRYSNYANNLVASNGSSGENESGQQANSSQARLPKSIIPFPML